MSDSLSIVWCWHAHAHCTAPDRNGCPGHSFLVTPMERARLESLNWRI